MTGLIVTGANGYIGRAVIAAAQARGIAVTALARQPVDGVTTLPYDMAGDLPPLPHRATIIHLAQQTRTNPQQPDVNIAAALRLLGWAAANESRVIFVSSQTARADAPTLYGRDKAAVETLMLSAPNAFIVRPGMVYGGTPAGLYGLIVKLVTHCPAIPALLPAPRVQPIHVDELATALLSLVALPNPSRRIYNIGSVPVAFTQFVQHVARAMGVHRLYLPVPRAFVTPLLTITELLPARWQAPLASVRSLLDLPVMETATSLVALGITLRPLTIQTERAAALAVLARHTDDAAFHDRSPWARLRSMALLPLALLREAGLFLIGGQR